ncbi:MAG: hypothetical protein JWN48_3201 [Myxococcaceae bacterium]|nr:hypothetical protein [Myxococcaceae bacterium]
MKRLAWLLLSGLVLSACTQDGTATELTLTVQSDLTVPDELDRVTVSVVGQELAQDPAADLREKPLPRSLTLVHTAGPLGPLQITVRGWRDSQLVVQKDLQAYFSASASKALTVLLERACKDTLCASGATCEQGSCVAVTDELDAGALLPDGSLPRPRPDAGGDARVPADATIELDADAAELVGTDAGTPPGSDASGSVPDASAAEAGLPDASPPSAGAPPSCALMLPVTGDSYQANTMVALRGSCSDPETGALTDGLRWSSQLEGPLGAGGSLDTTLKTVGTHHLSLCALDPRDPALTGCAAVDVAVSMSAQPSVAISAITQGNASAQPFASGSPLSFSGTASGAGVSLSWRDDLQGALGSGATVSSSTPLVGRHTVTLTVQDRAGLTRSATRSYVVVAAGESNLVSPFATVNATLDSAGDPAVSMIASDPQVRAYVPNSSGVLYRFDGSALGSPASVAIGQPPLLGVVQDAQLALEKDLSYLATDQGLTVCGYKPANGVVEPCTTYGRGLALQSANTLSVLRMSAGATDVLLAGTDSGVFLPDNVLGSTRGTVALRGRKIFDMLAVSGQAALATDNGLYLFAPTSQMTVRFGSADGLPSNQLSSLALGSDGSLWIGTSNGLANYQPTAPIASRWTSWNTDAGLAGNRVNGVAVQRVSELSPARDVVWIASSGGVTRLDTLTRTLQRFTTTDGLPSNEVLAVHVLANGIKLFGTSKGLGHYVGP